jgi:SAM-dependent methyltransferase
VIAPPVLPAEFVIWNAKTGASHSGPFSMYRYYHSTRIWEYPWAWHVAPVRPGMRVLDVGGALCGFSLTLARAGAEVVVVDPDHDLQSPPPLFDRWTRAFGVTVRTFRGDAMEFPEPPGTFDVAYCLSVIEHVPTAELRKRLMMGVHRQLRRGGLFVLTIDVALWLHPFTREAGLPELRNVSVAELMSYAPFQLVFGKEAELIGMPGFDPTAILRRAEAGEFLVDGNRLATQCLVLQAI